MCHNTDIQCALAVDQAQVLQFEAQYLAALPDGVQYEQSYMHRDTVTHVAVAPGPEFFITASADGVVKFWKKKDLGIEFAKQYRAHLGPVTALAVAADGTRGAPAATARSVKVGVVARVVMVAMLKRAFAPGALQWAFDVRRVSMWGRCFVV